MDWAKPRIISVDSETGIYWYGDRVIRTEDLIKPLRTTSMNDNYNKSETGISTRPNVSLMDQAANAAMQIKSYFAGILLIGGIALVLAACGGGGNSVLAFVGSSLQATLSGAAVDAPIANAQITFTAGAPLNDLGATTIGAITANASGVFTSTVTLPASAVPVFGNAVDPNNTAVVLSSYLGQSTALSVAAASGVLTRSNLPNLDITPVTTAALAVYARVNGNSYANLTPATYAANLQQYNGDILAIAAAIKAVGDNLCTPGITVGSTTNLAATIAANSSLASGNSTTLATAAATLGGNCATVLATLPQQISADPVFSPGLYVGDVIDEGVSSVPAVTTGVSSVPVTYTLQGVIAESGMTNANPPVAASSVAASVFTDTAVTIDTSGNITSSDGYASGALVGNLITLTVTNGSQQYSLRGKIGVIQSALVSGGSAYSIQGGGTSTSTNVLTNFTAVLVPAGVTPVWNGIAAPATASTTCAAGAFPIRLEAYGSGLRGGNVGECIVPSATGWTMSASTLPASYIGDDIVSSTPPSLTAPTWSEVSSSPFILSATASFTSSGNAKTIATTTTGTMYYVMGTKSVVFVSSAGNDSLLNMNCNALTQLAESVQTVTTTIPAASGVPGNGDNNVNTAASGAGGNIDNNGNQMNRYFH